MNLLNSKAVVCEYMGLYKFKSEKIFENFEVRLTLLYKK